MRYCLYYLFFMLGFSSCTVLQWRATDQEIKNYFEAKQIHSKISYFDVDSLDLKVRVQHVEASKAPIDVLFLHGSPSSLSAWNGYLSDTLLINKARLHAVDRPGYGYSNFGEAMPSIVTQAKVINGLIEDYKLKNIIVIGASYGGPLAARIAVENKNVKGVIMVSPAIDPKQEKTIWASRFTQWWLTRWLVPTDYRVAGDEKTVHAQELQHIEKDWAKVKVPVIHIHGDEDDLVPYTNINYSREKFNSIKIVSLPSTGHEIAWARPELIKPYLLQLIDEVLAAVQTNNVTR
jgi:pimeloyl-ACP methyl ester carboxylesterase